MVTTSTEETRAVFRRHGEVSCHLPSTLPDVPLAAALIVMRHYYDLSEVLQRSFSIERFLSELEDAFRCYLVDGKEEVIHPISDHEKLIGYVNHILKYFEHDYTAICRHVLSVAQDSRRSVVLTVKHKDGGIFGLQRATVLVFPGIDPVSRNFAL